MKQATKSFTQPSAWRKRLPGYAAMGVASIALALGLTGLMQARTTVSGTLLPLSDADAATYGIRSVYQLTDGTYLVTGAKKGFQSEVEAAVTLDAQGNVLKVEVLSQDETASLGGHCVDPEFTDQYQAAAPFTLAGKSYTVTDPATGATYAAAGAETETAKTKAFFNPAWWNVNDTSPEAEAMRKMYSAGLTLSALNGEPMEEPLGTSPEAVAHEKLYKAGMTLTVLNGEELTELPDTKDNSPEWTAMRKMYEAGLTLSALNGEALEKPVVDWPAEKLAQYRMEQAGLATGGTAADTGAVGADLTEVDALSGATITSAAVTDVVNNSYFYVTQVLEAE